jgi:hypothetical protein
MHERVPLPELKSFVFIGKEGLRSCRTGCVFVEGGEHCGVKLQRGTKVRVLGADGLGTRAATVAGVQVHDSDVQVLVLLDGATRVTQARWRRVMRSDSQPALSPADLATLMGKTSDWIQKHCQRKPGPRATSSRFSRPTSSPSKSAALSLSAASSKRIFSATATDFPAAASASHALTPPFSSLAPLSASHLGGAAPSPPSPAPTSPSDSTRTSSSTDAPSSPASPALPQAASRYFLRERHTDEVKHPTQLEQSGRARRAPKKRPRSRKAKSMAGSSKGPKRPRRPQEATKKAATGAEAGASSDLQLSGSFCERCTGDFDDGGRGREEAHVHGDLADESAGSLAPLDGRASESTSRNRPQPRRKSKRPRYTGPAPVWSDSPQVQPWPARTGASMRTAWLPYGFTPSSQPYLWQPISRANLEDARAALLSTRTQLAVEQDRNAVLLARLEDERYASSARFQRFAMESLSSQLANSYPY